EAILSGLSVITTNWSGQTDFCTEENSWLIDYDFQRAQSHFGIFSSVWAEPKVDHLAQIMREVQQAPDSVRQQKTKLGQQLLAEKFRWVDTAARMVQAARVWSEGSHAPEPRTGWITSWNTKCGIASYSEHLIKNMPSGVHVLAAHTPAPTAQDHSNVVRCWSTGDGDVLMELEQAVATSKINALVIQFNYGFFNFEHLSNFLHRQKWAGLKIFIVLHATNDPPHAPHKKLSFLAPALAQCDRVLVHSTGDLNRLKALGLVQNVALFPHGILDYEPPAKKMPSAPGHFTVASYGFFLPHKGLLELISAIEILHQKGMNIRLKMVNAEYPAPESRLAIEQAKSMVAKKELRQIIEFNTEYLPDAMSMKMLSEADVVIFPYQETGESSSAAVRYGIACGRPVAVTPLGIFDDVASAVHFLPGTSPQAIADGIVALAQDIAAQAPHFIEKNAASERWRNEHKYSRLGVRMHGLIRAVGHAAQAEHLPQRRKQLLFDVSQVYQHDDGTGIQRVVRNILAELQRATPAGYDICPLYGTKGENFRYTGKFHPAGSACANDGQTVMAGPGDIFLAVDLAAHLFPEAEQHLQALRRAGAQVFYVVHDIIPLRHAQYTIPFIQEVFDVWLRALGRCADGLVCVSNAVAQDVAAWLQEHQPATPLPHITHFHLGADMERTPQAQSLPPESAAVLQHIHARTSFLMVGTIEPRKGHAQTLAAFELLWAQGVQANLVIVGKSGWNTEVLVQQLRQHPENGQRLFWLEGINDAYLEAVYAASTCLIAASHCEGFGLPLIEAARYRLPILARATPVFREVAGEHAAYFDGTAPHDLASAIERWLVLHASGQHPRSDAMPWQTWAQSAQQLLQLLPLQHAELIAK
ncbi:MAG: glycosyltransferase, partial [Rhodoferax sp.]|nr:glycosyltransferase [Rhodoferax sp.]